VDLSTALTGARRDTLSRQSLDALQQIYGYMTFNNKFGILTNWQRALFLRRAETSLGVRTQPTNLDAESVGRHGVACRGRPPHHGVDQGVGESVGILVDVSFPLDLVSPIPPKIPLCL